MGITRFGDLLRAAQRGGYAVGSFNSLNLEMVRGVLAAAEEARAPVILCHAEVHSQLTPLVSIAPIMINEARRANVPVALLLDHGVSFEACVQALQLGLNAVMFDGSELPYEENIRQTAEMVRIAHAMGAEVEAELGHVTRPEGGGSGVAGESHDQSDTDLYTNPQQAAEFVSRTGVDALAVAFGTAHGLYVKKPELDFARLDDIRSRVEVPLVMHGGTGLSEAEFQRAIQGGVAKINYYTGMSRAAGRTLRDKYGPMEGDVFLHDMLVDTIAAVKQDAQAAMKCFGCFGKA